MGESKLENVNMLGPLVQYWHSEDLPGEIAELMSTFDEHNPGLQRLVFNEKSASRFVAAHFGSREVTAFGACATPTMQADYFRCCATFVLGGIYADADFRCQASLRPLLDGLEGGELFGVRGVPSGLAKLGLSREATFGDVERVGDYLFIANGFFAFRAPLHPLLDLTVDIMTAHIESRASENLVAITGGVFTSLYLLRELGSFDAFIDYASHGSFSSVAPITCEVIADYKRLREAFEGVRISRVKKLLQWVRHSHSPYKETEMHWLRSPRSIFR